MIWRPPERTRGGSMCRSPMWAAMLFRLSNREKPLAAGTSASRLTTSLRYRLPNLPKAAAAARCGSPIRALDDYGSLRFELRSLDRRTGTIGSAPLVVDLPPPIGNPRDGEGATFNDLTAHPWAGLDVSVQLVATDGPGQEGRSDRLSVKLPERVFRHPVALAIIAQCRALALAANQRLRIARELHAIAASPDQYGNDTAVSSASWPPVRGWCITAKKALSHRFQECFG